VWQQWPQAALIDTAAEPRILHSARTRSLRGANDAHWDAVIGAPVTAGKALSHRPRAILSRLCAAFGFRSGYSKSFESNKRGPFALVHLHLVV
jgi:hypothetical protein